MSKELVLILGGARGGKSSYAEDLARELAGEEVVFLATAEALDDEMKSRIADHQAARPASWRTVEAPSLLEAGLDATVAGAQAVLLDCLTLLTSNALLAETGPEDEPEKKWQAAYDEARVEAEVGALLELYHRGKASWIVVSNEVGLGLVPDNALGRAYRDALGRANQRVASAADRVVFLIAGLPLRLK